MIENVKNYIERARKNYPEVTDERLLENGAIYYMNGNDGTMFDFDENDRLCEFEVFYKSTEYCFLKVFVHKDGEIKGYFYDEKEKYDYFELVSEYIDVNMDKFAEFMDDNFDRKNHWNKSLEEVLG